jgi:hypothetical protein
VARRRWRERSAHRQVEEWLTVALVFTACSLVLASIVAHLLADVVSPGSLNVQDLLRKFDTDREGNIPTWWSSMLLAALAVLLALAGHRGPRTGSFRREWYGLAVLVGAMSLDEAASVHELAVPVSDKIDGLPSVLHFFWIVPGTLLLLVVAVALRRFVGALDTVLRRRLGWATAVYFLGALGLEAVGGVLSERYGEESGAYFAGTQVEEALELLGMGIAIVALVRWLRGEGERAAAGSPGEGASAATPRRVTSDS